MHRDMFSIPNVLAKQRQAADSLLNPFLPRDHRVSVKKKVDWHSNGCSTFILCCSNINMKFECSKSSFPGLSWSGENVREKVSIQKEVENLKGSEMPKCTAVVVQSICGSPLTPSNSAHSPLQAASLSQQQKKQLLSAY